jgi:hypothetical protein
MSPAQQDSRHLETPARGGAPGGSDVPWMPGHPGLFPHATGESSGLLGSSGDGEGGEDGRQLVQLNYFSQ